MFLSVKNIHKSYGNGDSRVEVLKGIDLEIEKGNFCVLLGPSGSGKSTLLNILGGIDSADEGTIQISHHVLENMSEKELTKLIEKVEKQMRKAAAELDFESAADLRDQMVDLKKKLEELKEQN